MSAVTRNNRSLVIGISAVSGGGKTAVTMRLAELLRDAVTLCFDDYDDTNVHPDSLPAWFKEGADYNVWQTPLLTEHLESLTSGQPVTSPVNGLTTSPARYVVFDAPLGRAHDETGRFIDLMVFIDTPLDVAMARRVLRDSSTFAEQEAEETLTSLRSEMSGYLDRARPIYVYSQDRQRDCDLILDGCLTVDQLAAAIHDRIQDRTPLGGG